MEERFSCFLEIVEHRDIEILVNPTTKSFCPTGHSVAEAWSGTGIRYYLKCGSDFPQCSRAETNQGIPQSFEGRYLISQSHRGGGGGKTIHVLQEPQILQPLNYLLLLVW